MGRTTVTPLATALGTVEDVADYCGQSNPSGIEATIFQRIVNAATTRVEKYCRRPFVARTITEIQDGKGFQTLYLRVRPVVSVTSVEWLNWDGTTFDTFTGSEIMTNLSEGTIRLQSGSRFNSGLQNWRIIYSASYANLAAVPDDVILAFLALCQKWWRDHTDRQDDIQTQTVEGQTIFFNQDEMPPKIAGMLSPYRLPVGMGC